MWKTIKEWDKLQLFIWSFSLLLFLVTFFYFLPRKEFDFTDYGYYLYNSKILSQGIVPSVGFATLPNAFFMLLGVHSYLFFLCLGICLMAFSMAVFWSSIKPLVHSSVFPLAVLVAVFYNFSIFSYVYGAECYLLVGFGCLLHAKNSQKIMNKKILFVLAGLTLSLAAFSNISLLPTFVSSWILVALLLRKQKQAFYFHIAYLLLGLGLLISYISSPLSFFSMAHYEKTSITYAAMIAKIPKLFIFLSGGHYIFFIGLILLAIGSIVSSQLFRINLGIISKPFFLIAILIAFLLGDFFFKILNNLDDSYTAGVVITHITLFVFYIMLAAFVLYIRKNDFYYKISILLLIMFSYLILLSITTTSNFLSHVAHLGAIYIIVFCIIVEESFISNNESILEKLNASLLMVVVFTIMLASLLGFVSRSYRAAPVYLNNKVKLQAQNSVLNGLYIDPDRLTSLNIVSSFYNKYECQNKYFLAYPALPLLYYIFSRKAIKNHAWIDDSVGYIDPAYVVDKLKAKKHWCVIIAPTFRDFTEYNGVKDFLDAHSSYKEFHSFLIKASATDYYPNQYILYAN